MFSCCPENLQEKVGKNINSPNFCFHKSSLESLEKKVHLRMKKYSLYKEEFY